MSGKMELMGRPTTTTRPTPSSNPAQPAVQLQLERHNKKGREPPTTRQPLEEVQQQARAQPREERHPAPALVPGPPMLEEGDLAEREVAATALVPAREEGEGVEREVAAPVKSRTPSLALRMATTKWKTTLAPRRQPQTRLSSSQLSLRKGAMKMDLTPTFSRGSEE